MTEQLDLGLIGQPPVEALPPEDPREPAEISDEQRSVVTFDDNLVVTAGAGSGKTRTLVALYARILADPASLGCAERTGPERVLCLTFTERAAREVKERIRSVLHEPNDRRKLETAPISTFHAFCSAILRRYPLEAGVDPGFAILTDEMAHDLLSRAATESLRASLALGDEAARYAVRTLGFGASVTSLVHIVEAVRTAGWTPREPIRRFEATIEFARDALATTLAGAVRETTDKLLDTATASRMTPKGRTYLAEFETALTAWLADPSPATSRDLKMAAKRPARSWGFDNHTPLRHAVIEAVDRYEGARNEISHATDSGCWPALSVSVRAAYRDLRIARRALDYDDLLLRTRDLLANRDGVRASLRTRFDAVLVDEHQDTNPVQNDILELLAEIVPGRGETIDSAPRWCVVGDAKQAIYGFRGARVEAFQRLSADANRRGARRLLRSNYRSRPELVSFFNAFFPRVLATDESPGQAEYEDQVAHREAAGRPCVETLFPTPPPKGAKPGVDELRLIEARALAMRLQQACDPQSEHAVFIADPDSGETRPARAGDVGLLMRRMTDVEPYRQALQSVGFEAVVVGSGGFYSRQETFDVLNAVEAVLAPENPVSLIAFLRSPMVGVADDTLLRLTRGWHRSTGKPLRSHIVSSTARGSSQDRAALDEAWTVLDELGARADREAPGATLSWLIDRTGYAAIANALPDRAQRLANLDRLVAQADHAPRNGVRLLSEWAASMRRRIENPPREQDAPIADPGNRVVLMSIHQAKGLEFPIVAIADIGTRGRSGPDQVVFDDEVGVVSKLYDPVTGKWTPTLSYARASERVGQREDEEEARLFYVAATRARDHLILSAGTRSNRWFELASGFADEGHDSVTSLRQEEWVARFATAVASQPPLPDPGRAYEEPTTSALRQWTAREMAELVSGPRVTGDARSRPAMRVTRRLGVAGHAALERLPLRPGPDFDLESWLTAQPGIEPDVIPALAAFIENTILPRFAEAREVLRECPFRLHLPDDSGIVVGTIDCLIEEQPGEWSVWDYKFGSADAERAAFHRAQLQIYALAAAARLRLDRIRGVVWGVLEDDADQHVWGQAELTEIETRLLLGLSAS